MGELCLLLQNVTLQVDNEDRWLWNLEKSNVYYVGSAYNFLFAQPDVVAPVDVTKLWQKHIPMKVVVFAWRLFRNRLPTKDNLLHCNVIDINYCLCVYGCGSLETANHLFLHCSLFGSVWNCILLWLGISMVAPFEVSDHFTRFVVGGGGSQVWSTMLNVVWFATVWEIWKEKNNKIFKVKNCSIMCIVDKIKSLSFLWLKEKFIQFSFNYHGWWLNPLAMLGYN